MLFALTTAVGVRAQQGGAAPAGAVTFNHDVAPILFANCVSCHRPGEVAPFSLLTYADARRHAKEIAELTSERQMPPWKAAEGFGEFLGARRLSDQQIETINNGSSKGSPRVTRPTFRSPRSSPTAGRWASPI